MTEYLLRYLLLMAILLTLWAAFRRPHRHWCYHEGLLMLFVMLFGGLLCLVLDGTWATPAEMLSAARTRLATGEKIQMQPLFTIRRMLSYGTVDEILINLWGNVVMFVPFGFFLPLLWARFRRPFVMVLCCLLLPVAIECSQLFIGRMTDIDDILLNFIGGMLGCGFFLILHRCFPDFTTLCLERK